MPKLMYFDDLVVADEIPLLAAKPAGRLAIAWGEIRRDRGFAAVYLIFEPTVV